MHWTMYQLRWRYWRRLARRDYMENKNVWDLFTGRHIPVLRE